MAGCYHELERMARLCVLRNLKYTIKRDKRELVMVCENLRRMYILESNILAQY